MTEYILAALLFLACGYAAWLRLRLWILKRALKAKDQPPLPVVYGKPIQGRVVTDDELREWMRGIRERAERDELWPDEIDG